MVLIQTRNDDLTGEPDAITCVITVNGRGIEIDLAEKSLQKLTKALEPYWQAGSESAYDIQRKGVGRRVTQSPPNVPDVEERRAIRQWAIAQGLMSPQARGRIPQSVVDKYRAEH
jgi:hypothetical protein